MGANIAVNRAVVRRSLTPRLRDGCPHFPDKRRCATVSISELTESVLSRIVLGDSEYDYGSTYGTADSDKLEYVDEDGVGHLGGPNSSGAHGASAGVVFLAISSPPALGDGAGLVAIARRPFTVFVGSARAAFALEHAVFAYGATALTAPPVFAVRHGFKVIGIAAGPHAAKMVDHQPRRDRADTRFVGRSVNTHTRAKAGNTGPTVATLMKRAGPYPARRSIATIFDHDPRPDVFHDSPARHAYVSGASGEWVERSMLAVSAPCAVKQGETPREIMPPRPVYPGDMSP